MANLLLVRIIYENESKYYKLGKDSKLISLKNEKRLKLPIEGDIEFLNINDKWKIINKSDVRLGYGLRKMKMGDIKPLKYNKPIVYKGYKIIAVEYKDKKPERIDSGLIGREIDLTKKTEFIIGSSQECDLIIDNPQMDSRNTRIIHDGDIYYIEDLGSANGLIINGKKYKNKILENYDTITLPGAIYMLVGDKLLHSASNTGIRIDVHHISKSVKDFESHKQVKLVDDVSLTIKEGEYVAIVGGSGAGKSTFLDCVNGRRPMTKGKIYYDNNDYYKYLDSYEKIVGYVPQYDIMHTDLSVYKTLYYYAQIRMHHHLTKEELNKLVLDSLKEVSLLEKKDVIVHSLSGGQRKRVSIAMELLANPKVIFLDEPTSGLSPDLDYELMSLLKKLSASGKTIIIITHNMENVDKCDKIAFLGKGGSLCYYGAPKNIFKYFGVKKYGQIFSMLAIKENVSLYHNKLLADPDYIKMVNEMDELYNKNKESDNSMKHEASSNEGEVKNCDNKKAQE